MTEVKLPRLLNSDFSEHARLHPALLSVPDPLRGVGESQMTLTELEPDIAMHDWMELYTQEGSAGMWRVTSMAWTVRKERIITLRHGIDTLSDSVWRAQIDFDGTVSSFLTALLGYQTTTYWQLGQVDDTGAYKRQGINYTRLSDLLNELGDNKPEYALQYDFTTTPWTLSYRALPSSAEAECRLARNISTCRITYDDSEFCNRLYMTWSVKTATTTGDEITTTIRTYNDTASQSVYGIIEKTANVEDADEPSPDAWAARFLAERKEPRALIEIEGIELERLTGLTWDRFSRGRMIRLALADYGVTINARAANVIHPDALGRPSLVQLELSNSLRKFSETIADISKTASYASGTASGAMSEAKVNSSKIGSLGGRMGSAEQSIATLQADIVYIEGTELVSIKGRMVTVEGEVITLTAKEAANEGNIASLEITAQGIQAQVTANSGDISTLQQTATSISATVANKVDKSSIVITADSITVDTKTFTVDATTIVNKLVGQTISVGGLTTAGLTVLGSGTLTGGLTAATLSDGDGMIYQRSVKMGSGTYGTVVAHTSADLDLSHAHAISCDSSGVVTVGNVVAVGNSGASFNIADTAFYQSGVSAAQTTGWNNAAAAVSWPSAGTGNAIGIVYPVSGGSTTTKAYVLTQGSWSGTSKYVYLRENTAQGSAVARTEIDASSIYNAGVSQVTSNITLSTGSWNSSGQRTVAAKYNGTTYASSTISMPTITVDHTSWDSSYQCTARAYASGIGYVDTDTIDASSVYSAGYSEGYSDGESSSSYSSRDLHISKSSGDVLLYLGDHVVSRTCSIYITSLVKSSNSNAWNITVEIDGDTNFYFTKLPTG